MQGEGCKVRCWAVERRQSQLNRFRRILVWWEKLPVNYLAVPHLPCGVIVWRNIQWARFLIFGTSGVGLVLSILGGKAVVRQGDVARFYGA